MEKCTATNTYDSAFWTEKYNLLRLKTAEFCDGKINSTELKKFSAPLGIYEQRNGKFMVRVRVTAGDIRLSELRKLADISIENNVEYIHITTRQCLQLHNVSPENIHSIVQSCNDSGIPFRGGGGDTYRNIIACHHSGISEKTVFDTTPYAKALNEFMFSYEKAFALPRKFKIGFFCCPEESFKAKFQDIGFAAKKQDGIEGFELFGGGGMGRESAAGVKLSDFIPADEIFKCAKALTDLFYDHGDRSNRAKARLRFFVMRVGGGLFREMFADYYRKTVAPLCETKPENYSEIVEKIKKTSHGKIIEKTTGQDFQTWFLYAVKPTVLAGEELKSLEIFLPFGNIKPGELNRIIDVMDANGCDFLRLTQNQNIFLPLVHVSVLPLFFDCQKSSASGFILNPSDEIPVACVGAKTCKIGMLDSPSIALKISEIIKKTAQNFTGLKASKISSMIKSIKISGCPNACGGHVIAALGIQGFQKSSEGKISEFARVMNSMPKEGGTSLLNEEIVLRLDDMPALIGKIACDYFNSEFANFADFISGYDGLKSVNLKWIKP
jgi:sulfite reductase beta subunit-like hemoprotein